MGPILSAILSQRAVMPKTTNQPITSSFSVNAVRVLGWLVGWLVVLSILVGCFGFNGSLRQYFSLYRAVSHREGERGKKG